MPGIPREVAGHSLDIRVGSKPVKQRLRRFDEEKRRAIGEEIHKLLAAGFIKEVFHLEWLANPVLVKKKNGKWRMCPDYTSLNKACPKKPFSLPRIDQIVDSTAGCEILSFLDAYSGYHQIKMTGMFARRKLRRWGQEKRQEARASFRKSGRKETKSPAAAFIEEVCHDRVARRRPRGRKEQPSPTPHQVKNSKRQLPPILTPAARAH